jgi:hypothetical protein
MLTKARIDDFRRDGFVVVDGAVTRKQLAALNAEIAQWVAESRNHDKPFGPPTINGRPRFDMGAEHSAEHPALRRINNPSRYLGGVSRRHAQCGDRRYGGRSDRAERQVSSLQD